MVSKVGQDTAGSSPSSLSRFTHQPQEEGNRTALSQESGAALS